jgi:hypothetical protein
MQGEPVWGLTGATGSSQKKRIPFAALRAKDRALCVLCAFAPFHFTVWQEAEAFLSLIRPGGNRMQGELRLSLFRRSPACLCALPPVQRPQDRAVRVFDCRMANDPAMMSSTNRALVLLIIDHAVELGSNRCNRPNRRRNCRRRFVDLFGEGSP